MKRFLNCILLSICILGTVSPIVFVSGCSTTSNATSGGPVVVNSEKTIETAFNVIDAFVRWEYQNRAVVSKDVHDVAQSFRKDAPDAFRTARAVLRAYKENRTPEQKALLDTWLASLTELANRVPVHSNK